MAGSVSINQEYFGRKRSIIMKCTSDASGDVNGKGIQVQGGDIYAFSYVPESGCTDEWDITVTAKYTKPNGESIQIADALGGQGADLSNSTDGGWINLQAPFPIIPGTLLTPVLANLGNAQVVTIILHIWEEILV